MKDCTTCKYGYEDERLGIRMCHHPKRFSEDCINFNMHEEKESEHLADARKTSLNDLEEVADKYEKENTGIYPEVGQTSIRDAFIDGYNLCREQMMKVAVNGWLDEDNEPPYDLNVVCEEKIPFGKFKHGDKVKLIIIKEE